MLVHKMLTSTKTVTDIKKYYSWPLIKYCVVLTGIVFDTSVMIFEFVTSPRIIIPCELRREFRNIHDVSWLVIVKASGVFIHRRFPRDTTN